MTPFVRDAIRKIAIIAAFACCAIMGAVLLYEAATSHRLAHDYAVYWRTANQPVEAAYALRNFQPFPYAPTMLIWVEPLSLVPELVGYFLVVGAGIVAMLLACRPYLSKWALVLLLVSAPMVRCIRNGQVSAILAALLIWSCGAANRVAAGAALGIIASIKPQLVVMAPLMLVLNKDWRAFFSAGAAFVATVLLSLALFGSARWPEWLASMDHFQNLVSSTPIISIGVTPATVAESFGLNPLPFLALGVLAGAALVYACREMGPLEKATAIGAGSLLASPYALAYDLVVVMPFIATSVVKGRLLGFIALAAMLNPLPLLVTAYELARRWLPAPLRTIAARKNPAPASHVA